MAITRMQQPRQMYGLGSFVKKTVKKVTKPFTKVAKKIVPKEIAGIMRVAAPFLPPGYREAAYLLGTAKQTGRISPIDLALVSAPYINKALGSQKSLPLMERKGLFAEKLPGANEFLFGAPERTLAEASLARTPSTVGETTGILGSGGKMFQFGSDKGGLLDNVRAFRDQSKLGSLLLGGKEPGTFSKAKIAGLGVGTLSLIQNADTPREAGIKLAQSTGNSDDRARGEELFALLKPELFEVPEQFRMDVQDGGMMRTNYARGSDDDEDKPVLPEDPTEPVNPFAPKPIKPLGEMKMAGSDRYQKILEEIINEMEGMLGRELTDAEYNLAGQLAYDKLSDPDYAVGGRVDYALGTKPTAEESGLGGLPIEADMRYTGGFMPYGAKEKADDVPARLSKNEFVFTADAVRAAGGGSVNEGAKKMYQTMKKLEAKPEAKGMTA